jgi:hypothetical protein
MPGNRERGQEELFVVGAMRDLIPDDYILKRVDNVLDLSWLRAEVKALYDARQGRPSIDSEAAVHRMLAGFFHGIVYDRRCRARGACRWGAAGTPCFVAFRVGEGRGG